MPQAERRLANVLAGLHNFERAVVAHHPRQVGPLNEFHREVISAFDLVGVIGPDNIGMAELGRGANLALKAQNHLGIVQAFLANDLEGDAAVEQLLAGLEDLPHAPFAEPFGKHEGSERQAVASALKNLVNLKRREPAA